MRSVSALIRIESSWFVGDAARSWLKIGECHELSDNWEIVMPFDQARETRLHDELDKLHKELDQVRRDGWDHGARVSVVERHIVQFGGVVLGLVVLGLGVPFSYLLGQASSFWGASVILAVGLGLVTLAFWTFQHFRKSPQ